MRMTFTKSAYDVQDGKFLARFDGVTMKEATGARDQRGNLMPPGMTWDFTLLEGPDNGKKTDRLTGRAPTPKSGCGKMLAAIADTILKDGMEVELDPFVGKVYRVTVEDGRVSDNPAPVRVYDAAPAGAAPAPAAPPRSGPPPRKPVQPTERRFWVPLGDQTPLMTESDIRTEYAAQRLSPDAEVCPEGGAEYKPLKEFLTDLIPF